MLFNIHTGYNGVTQRPNKDIAILVTSCQALADNGVTVLFTDRHAYTATAAWTANRDELAEKSIGISFAATPLLGMRIIRTRKSAIRQRRSRTAMFRRWRCSESAVSQRR